MNAERDTDRRLRAWVSEGVDRAPERFVWAALDDIETTSQRRPWLTTLEGWGGRLRPAFAVATVAAVLVVAAAVVLRVAQQDGLGAPRAFTTADLQAIVLWEDTKPASWTLDNLVSNPDEILRIPVRSMTDQELLSLERPPGYIFGRYTNFSEPSAAGLYMSWSALFATAEQAEAAMPFFRNELESPEGWGYGPGEPIGFGDGGFRYTGDTTSFNGPPGTNEPLPSDVYLWRDGNLLLALGGWFEFDAAEVRAAAQGMSDRAEASAAGTR